MRGESFNGMFGLVRGVSASLIGGYNKIEIMTDYFKESQTGWFGLGLGFYVASGNWSVTKMSLT